MKSKSELRIEYKKIRAQVSDQFRQAAGKALCHFLSRYPTGINWLSYKAIHSELSTDEHFKWALFRGDRVYFPKTDGDKMSFFSVTSLNEMKQGSYGLEPTPNNKWVPGNATIALVPGLVFSRDGFRIGYGKAFYDRFLNLHPQIIRIGVGFAEQINLKGWQPAPHDEALDMIWTPSGVWPTTRLDGLMD